jgi:topoisomerase IA-like protein
MPIGRRNRVLAQEGAAQQLADSIAPPAEEFQTPAKKAAEKKTTKKKKAPKKDQ